MSSILLEVSFTSKWWWGCWVSWSPRLSWVRGHPISRPTFLSLSGLISQFAFEIAPLISCAFCSGFGFCFPRGTWSSHPSPLFLTPTWKNRICYFQPIWSWVPKFRSSSPFPWSLCTPPPLYFSTFFQPARVRSYVAVPEFSPFSLTLGFCSPTLFIVLDLIESALLDSSLLLYLLIIEGAFAGDCFHFTNLEYCLTSSATVHFRRWVGLVMSLRQPFPCFCCRFLSSVRWPGPSADCFLQLNRSFKINNLNQVHKNYIKAVSTIIQYSMIAPMARTLCSSSSCSSTSPSSLSPGSTLSSLLSSSSSKTSSQSPPTDDSGLPTSASATAKSETYSWFHGYAKYLRIFSFPPVPSPKSKTSQSTSTVVPSFSLPSPSWSSLARTYHYWFFCRKCRLFLIFSLASFFCFLPCIVHTLWSPTDRFLTICYWSRSSSMWSWVGAWPLSVGTFFIEFRITRCYKCWVHFWMSIFCIGRTGCGRWEAVRDN